MHERGWATVPTRDLRDLGRYSPACAGDPPEELPRRRHQWRVGASLAPGSGPSEGAQWLATSLHHIALACKDPVETHRFYHDVLGLRLVHTESQKGPKGERVTHFFYDLGDGSFLAFFDVHGVGEPDDLDPAISTGLGLPIWVNHFALRRDLDELPAIKERMRGFGIEPTMEADHGWCTSIYYTDPNGIMIEFCADTPGVEADEAEAERVLFESTRAITHAGGVDARP